MTYLLASLLSCLLLSPLFAGMNDESARLESSVLKHFASGDDIGLYDSLEAMLLYEPGNPVAALYFKDLVYLSEIAGPERVEKSLKEIIKRLLPESGMYEKSNLLQAKIALHLLYEQNFPQKSKVLTRELFPLDKWILIGPYRQYGPGDLDHAFMPELIYDLAQFKDRKTVLSDTISGSINASSYLFPDSGIAYAATSFHTEVPIKLRIYSDTFYRAYVNRKEAVINTKDSFRNCRIVKIEDTKDITLMIKLYRSRSWDFRVIVTDFDDILIRPVIFLEHLHQKGATISSVEEHPHDYLIRIAEKDPVKGYGYLGDYFSELGSSEAIEWYQKSISLKKNIEKKYFMADTMVRLSNGRKGSALYLEGWRILNEIHKEDPSFIPAANRHLENLITSFNYQLAIKTGRKLIKDSPRFMSHYIEMLHLYSRIDFKKEFFDLLNAFKFVFPQSLYPLMLESEFWRNRDRKKYNAALESVLKERFNRKALQHLVQSYTEVGKYRQALSILKLHATHGNWHNNTIEILIKAKEYEKAKKLIFTRIVERDEPSLYYKLGMIDFFRDMDPSMYWERMLAIDPSVFTISDYLGFIQDEKKFNPFVEFTWDEKNVDRFLGDGYIKSCPSTVLKRTYVFKLNKDGSSRFFCDEVVKIHTQRGVESWGEYKVPFRGKLSPMRVRVFHAPGVYFDSYGIQKVDYDSYLIINALKVNSLLHISYIVDNPIKDPLYSTYFSPPPFLIQHYDEAVNEAACVIIAPENMPIHFMTNRNEKITVEKTEGLKIYTLRVKDIAPANEEFYSGSDYNCLPYFSFTTMNKYDDFIRWYGGLIAETGRLKASPKILALKGINLEDTLNRVYSFLSRNMELQNNVMYYPAAVEDTLYSRRGTPEDKVLLAKSILQLLGIESYISFVPERFFKIDNEYVSPSSFSHILLFVPVSVGKGVWLDFSNQYYTCGTVSGHAINNNTLIMLKKGFTWKEVKESTPSVMINQSSIKLKDNGGATISMKSIFLGHNGSVREFFSNRNEQEENINRYFGKIIPSLEVASSAVKNLDDLGAPFEVSIEGTSPRIALIHDKSIIIQPVMNKSAIYGYIRYQKRKYPLWITYAVIEKEDYLYQLPSNDYKKMNKFEQRLQSKFGTAYLSIESQAGSNQMRVLKEINIDSTYIKADEYDDFLKFCMQLKNMEETTVSIDKN